MTDGAFSWLRLVFAERSAGSPVRRGDQRLAGRYPCYRVYMSKDGRFYSVAALEGGDLWDPEPRLVGGTALGSRGVLRARARPGRGVEPSAGRCEELLLK